MGHPGLEPGTWGLRDRPALIWLVSAIPADPRFVEIAAKTGCRFAFTVPLLPGLFDGMGKRVESLPAPSGSPELVWLNRVALLVGP